MKRMLKPLANCSLAAIVAAGLLIASAPALAAPIDDLTTAAEFDDARGVLALLARGVDPNSADSRGRTPLALALREDSLKALDSLLTDPRLEIDAANANGETPVMLAAIKGQLGAVQKLVKRGARINRDGWTPLHYACSGPDNGVAAWLLSQGAALNARSPNGTTALMMASRYGPLDLASVLLKAGADASLRNDLDLSAADFAMAVGRTELAALLRTKRP